MAGGPPSARKGMVTLTGTYRAVPSEPRLGAAPPQERVDVTVHLRGPAQGLAQHLSFVQRQPVQERTQLTRPEFERRFGARPPDVAAVLRFAADNGLNVVAVNPGQRTVQLSGTVAAMDAAFGVQLFLAQGEAGVFRARTGSISVPADLAPAIVAVLGLDTRPAAFPHMRFGPPVAGVFRPFAGPATAFNPPEVGRLYGFPTGLNPDPPKLRHSGSLCGQDLCLGGLMAQS